MRVMFELLEQIDTILSQETDNFETKRTEINKSRSTIYGRDFRVSYNQSIRQKCTEYSDTSIKVYTKFGNTRHDE